MKQGNLIIHTDFGTHICNFSDIELKDEKNWKLCEVINGSIEV